MVTNFYIWVNSKYLPFFYSMLLMFYSSRFVVVYLGSTVIWKERNTYLDLNFLNVLVLFCYFMSVLVCFTINKDEITESHKA